MPNHIMEFYTTYTVHDTPHETGTILLSNKLFCDFDKACEHQDRIILTYSKIWDIKFIPPNRADLKTEIHNSHWPEIDYYTLVFDDTHKTTFRISKLEVVE